MIRRKLPQQMIGVASVVLLLAGCGAPATATPVPTTVPPDQVETQAAATTDAGQTATAAVERAVEMTLTALAALPTDTSTPSPTLEPPTAIPATATPSPTATTAPTPAPAPQVIPLFRRCGTTFTVQAGRPLEIRYGAWGVLGEDLARQNAEHLAVRLVIDGEQVTGVQQPVVPASAEFCGIPADLHVIFYVARVGPLSAGSHAVLVTWTLDEQVTDGGDVNGHGALDLYGPGEVAAQQFEIITQ